MKTRLIFLTKWFLFTSLVFVIQKPIFMLYNSTFGKDCSLMDYINVMLHGLKLDTTTTGYLIIIPFLLTLASIWINKINLQKILLPYHIIISFLISLIFVADMTLYDFWEFKLDATVFFYLDSPKEAFASVSTGFLIIRALATIILTIITCWGYHKCTIKQVPAIHNKWATLGSFLLYGGLIFIFIRGGITESTSNVGRAYFSKNQFLNHSAVNPCFSMFYSMGKSEDFANQFNFFPENERAEWMKGLYPQPIGETTKYLLNQQRPNILFIQMESFTGTIIEALGGEPNVTPNFARYIKEGVFFNQCYANSYRSDRGTVCNFSGYLGFPTTSVMKMPIKSQTLPSIARTLVKAGYSTDFLYGGDIDFTNMQSYFRSTGYQHITSDVDFTFQERHTHAWGVNDDITFKYLLEKIKSRKDSLWHTGFFTLSSHDPFIVPYHRLDNKFTNSIAYTDDCLGKFLDALKETEAWKNLLIIIVADHGYCYPKGINKHDPIFFHIPMLWLGGAIKEPAIISTILTQSDIAATLMGQLGLPYNDFKFSRNIFSDTYTYPFAFTSYNNGLTFKDSTGISVFDNNAGDVILEEPSSSEVRVNKGKAILQTIYDDLGCR